MKPFFLLKLTFFSLGFLTAFINIIEFICVKIFQKPIFVHLYLVKKKLPKREKKILQNNSSFYKKLTPRHKIYFEHRLTLFIRRYKFISRDGFSITPEVKVLIACSYLKLTFGMRRYLTSIFDKIIVYPKSFYSVITKQYHKGEFNPALKIIAFSWEDFLAGNRITNDNINLGIHEFTHALTFHGKKSNDNGARLFYSVFLEITMFMDKKERIKQIKNSNYFRPYALTNRLEFIAVVMEHFFETPKDLEKAFPELYRKIKVMLNYTPG